MVPTKPIENGSSLLRLKHALWKAKTGYDFVCILKLRLLSGQIPSWTGLLPSGGGDINVVMTSPVVSQTVAPNVKMRDLYDDLRSLSGCTPCNKINLVAVSSARS